MASSDELLPPADRPIRGRGASHNPANRFDEIAYEPDESWDPSEDPAPTTQFLRDNTRDPLSKNDSPDIPFDVSFNPYRGCEHGCIYCYARPTHEYLGFSAGLDFETKIMVKEDAPELLRKRLMSPRYEPKTISISGVTDPYQPVEKRLALTRRCLEVFAEFRNPVGIVTKNRLVTRDLDVLRELAHHDATVVFISLTTLDVRLNRTLEPRTSLPGQRLRAIETIAEAGVPVGVIMAPIIPGLTDEEIPAVLGAAANAGATTAGYVALRLPHAVALLFERWLDQHYPLRKDRILNRVRDMRGGALYQAEFGARMRGEGFFADQIERLFAVSASRAGLSRNTHTLSTASFARPQQGQMGLFE